MLKKTIRRLGALAMVLAMAVSVFAVSASAAEGDTEQTSANANPKFSKTVEVKGANAKLQFDETFEFDVSVPEVSKSSDTIYDNPGAAAISVATVKFDAGTAANTTKDFAVTVVPSAFKDKPGTYYYLIKEKSGSTDGMTYSTAEKLLAVQVLADNTINYYIVQNGNGNAKNDGTFTNTYEAHKLTVEKKITGTQADPNEAFDIYVTINGAAGETYETNKKDTTLTSGTRTKISLKGGESIEIYNLSAGDTYTVDEDDKYVTSEGYEVKGEVTTATAIGTADAKVTIENIKNASTPGGVIMTIAPYALMLVVAGAFAVVFLSRRNRAE